MAAMSAAASFLQALPGLQAGIEKLELSGLKLGGELDFPAPAAPAEAWSLGPLAAAQGTVHAKITDAHLLFDADVTVPVRQGGIDFDDATVEHVGPDSRMGVSRMGLYVDAPNGRTYLFQFPSTAIAGVEYEQRGALLGPFVTDRGKLRLQPFLEGMLRQGPAAKVGPGFTEQTRLLLDRTALSGSVQLGDGAFSAPGLRGEMHGSANGRNAIRLHSDAVGRGVKVEIAALSMRDVSLDLGGLRLLCDAVDGSLSLRVFAEGGKWKFAFELPKLVATGLRAAT
jgi:hypothetical protein